MVQIEDVSVFSFNNKSAGAEACNMSRWMDLAGMVSSWGIAIKKDEEALEIVDEVEINAMEGVGMMDMCARLVMVPKSMGTAIHHLHRHRPDEFGEL